MKARKLLLALCAFMIMGGNAVMAQEQTIPEEFAKENIFGLGEKTWLTSSILSARAI